MSYNIEQIKTDFAKVIKYSQGIANPKIDDLFDNWQNNKAFFINKFGDNLIWESPEIVSFPLDSTTRKKKLDKFITDCVLSYADNFELARFLEEERDGFYDNTVVKEYKVSPTITIPEGAKLSKAFKHFMDDDRLLDYLQTQASMLIQENKVEGRLCISVHPLDFLSASENQHSWHSCHALDGEYRAGNLSYMGDKDTIICYLKSERDVKLPDFPEDVPWNNKKWRMWLYLADEHNALMAGRQYPFDIQGIREYIRTILFNLLDYHEGNWSHWHNEFATGIYTFNDMEEMPYRRAYAIGGGIIPVKQLIKDVSSLHYNDLLYSSYYTPFYCWRTTTEVPVQFTIGSNVKCLRCGTNNIPSSDTMVCNNCYYTRDVELRECDHCGALVPWYTLNSIDDHHYCNQCYHELYTYCSCCGEFIRKNRNMMDHRPGAPADAYLCRHCYNTLATDHDELEPAPEESASHTTYNTWSAPATLTIQVPYSSFWVEDGFSEPPNSDDLTTSPEIAEASPLTLTF